ncbi:MAG TPA: trypsin-like peptidase domain-containing protein [Stackebrandtia sp.]|jgi:putative serine protease PepD|uniref:S1C family serine protease n=1 Tax=Stackebrandtia sp. TaxID=2023065 RepID=UPI002D30F355|nr:trypsin-like peptidase domain-containing protein [Stackebrandtia sp.]HZE38625.1 trypsin-like peptidase domain-containing protein [Stackebrandtia sp.]
MSDGVTPGSGQPQWNTPGTPQQPPAPQPPTTPSPAPAPAPTGQYPTVPTGQHPTAAQHNPSAWWAHNAPNDPWRNPQSPAVVQHTPAPHLPPLEQAPFGAPPRRRGGTSIGVTILIAVLCSLLAGTLGTLVTLSALKNSGATISGDDEGPHGDYQAMVNKVLPSVVTIWIETSDGGGNGSGWVYSKDGYIVTNHHVAALAESDSSAKMTVQFNDGTTAKATTVGSGKATDIAVIKVDKKDLPPLTPVQDSDKVQVGDPVVAIGTPLGLSNTVTEGIVSSLDRPVVAGESKDDATITAAIQTDAAINPGNSGGPLVNTAGKVIGVNASIYPFTNDKGEAGNIGLGFAIPGNQAVRVAKEIIDNGKPTRPVLGAELNTDTTSTIVETGGAKVKSVSDSTPASKAGIKEGDTIVKFGKTVITDGVQLEGLVLKHAPGDDVSITYEHDGTASQANITLGSEEDK